MMWSLRIMIITIFLYHGLTLPLSAQQGVVATGGTHDGTGGTISHAAGQVDFTYYVAPDGSLQFGLHQNFGAMDYELFLSAEPINGGAPAGAGVYQPGEVVALIANPDAAFLFLNWTLGDQIISHDPVFDYTMPAENTWIYAQFAEADDDGTGFFSLMLDVNDPDAGTIDPGVGSFPMIPGQIITVTATSIDGGTFINWTDGQGDVYSDQPTITYEMGASGFSLTANFDPPPPVPLAPFSFAVFLLMIVAFRMHWLRRKTTKSKPA